MHRNIQGSHLLLFGFVFQSLKRTLSLKDMPLLMLDSYSAVGFRLNNGMRVFGPVAVFPTCVLSWLVPSGAEGGGNSIDKIVAW